MMRRGRQPWTAARTLSDRFSAVAAVAVAAIVSWYISGLSPSVAQPRWDTITATTMGGDLAQRLAVPYAQPEVQSPPLAQLQPGAAAAAQSPWTTSTVTLASGQKIVALQPIPKGPWSTIVTGAIGEEAAEVRPPAGFQRVGQAPEPSAPAPPAEQAAEPKPAADAAKAAPAAAPAPTAEAQHKPLEALPPDATPVQQYCFNTADPAADARFAWQAKKITEMEAELEKRVALLEAKTEEFKTWLARRDDFSKKAAEKLVAFYTRMRPDAAALQLAAMEEETAAAVLTKLEAKAASAVMAEMDPARAAKLAAIISGASKIPRPKPHKPQAEGADNTKPRAEGTPAMPAGMPADNGAAAQQGRKS